MISLLARLVCGAFLMSGMMAIAPAQALPTQIGYAFLEDFEGYTPGPRSIDICDASECLGLVSGGSIIAATQQFPARSGSYVYAGTDVSFTLYDPYNIAFHLYQFYISTGFSPVLFEVFKYDHDLGANIVLRSEIIRSDTSNMFVSIGDEFAQGAMFTNFRLTSPSLFAIDDLKIGLEDTIWGIPEPSSWLMMIVGFAAIGTSLRRRRAALADSRISA
jgi:hypothetical protein